MNADRRAWVSAPPEATYSACRITPMNLLYRDRLCSRSKVSVPPPRVSPEPRERVVGRTRNDTATRRRSANAQHTATPHCTSAFNENHIATVATSRHGLFIPQEFLFSTQTAFSPRVQNQTFTPLVLYDSYPVQHNIQNDTTCNKLSRKTNQRKRVLIPTKTSSPRYHAEPPAYSTFCSCS